MEAFHPLGVLEPPLSFWKGNMVPSSVPGPQPFGPVRAAFTPLGWDSYHWPRLRASSWDKDPAVLDGILAEQIK